MKVLFLEGTNQYGVIDFFIDGMKADLTDMGIEVGRLDFSPEQQSQSLEQLRQGVSFDVVISFNGIGLDINTENGKGYFESSGKPLFIFLVDHPIHLITRFLNTPATVLCVDQEHVGFCQLVGIKAFFFPHAIGSRQIRKDVTVVERIHDQWLFPVSFFDESHWRQKLQPVWHQVEPIVNQAGNITRFLQLLGVLPLGQQPATVTLDANVLTISRFVDFYIRARSRRRALADCQSQGITLTVVGNGVQKYAQEFPRHNYENSRPFDALLQEMAASKYVLHNSPGFERGLHERLIIPMATMTLPVLTDEPFAADLLAGDSFVPRIDEAKSLSDREYQDALQRNQQAIIDNHTWKRRFSDLFAASNIA